MMRLPSQQWHHQPIFWFALSAVSIGMLYFTYSLYQNYKSFNKYYFPETAKQVRKIR